MRVVWFLFAFCYILHGFLTSPSNVLEHVLSSDIESQHYILSEKKESALSAGTSQIIPIEYTIVQVTMAMQIQRTNPLP